MSHPVRRSIICQVCNRPRQTQSRFDVCPGCASTLPKMRCDACRQLRFQLLRDAKVCHGCLNKLLQEKVSCMTCCVTDNAFKSDPTHCRKCHRKADLVIWKKSWSKRIICSSCGKEKQAWKKSGTTCHPCYLKQTSGNLGCLFPGCDKLMQIWESQLCRIHHEDQNASTLLKEYFESHSSPFPQNELYMAKLAATIDWEAVENDSMKIRGRDLARFRAFGSFLETHELPEVLTRQAIEQALPRLGQTNSVKIGFIRSCLFELGDILAERGEIQDRSSHLHENALQRSLQRCSTVFLVQVSGFQQWLVTGMLNPTVKLSPRAEPLTIAPLTIAERVSATIRFLNFCSAQNIVSLTQIGQSVIARYQETMLWQWECKKCHNRFPFESSRQITKCANRECEGMDSYVRVRRLSRGTLISHTSHLRVFFDWAELHQMVQDNPFSTIYCGGARTFTVRDNHGKMIEISESIRRYDDTTVEKLCAYIVSPEADVEEAIILFFIIFQLFTSKDLRKLRILSPLKMDRPSRGSSQANMLGRLYLPLRQPTRGHRSPTRTDTRIRFPRKALSWLLPLLERYHEQRANMVKTDQQQHLLVGERTARCSQPVTKSYIADRVRKASLKVLGGVITPSDLRRTAADIVAKRSKRRGAILTVMGYSRLAAIRFNYLEGFPLQPKNPRSDYKLSRGPRGRRRAAVTSPV